MKLYELTGELLEIQAMLDEGELTQEQLKDTLEASTMAYDQKALGLLYARENALMDISNIDAQIDRLKALRSAPERDVAWLTEYLRESMEALNKDKLNLGHFKVTLRKASPRLDVIDESKIPADYFEFVPASTKLDKRALLAAAKLEPIAGCAVVDGKRGLVVK